MTRKLKPAPESIVPDELNEMIRDLAKEKAVRSGVHPDLVDGIDGPVRAGGEEERRQAIEWRRQLIAELQERMDWVAAWRAGRDLNAQIEALCEAKGWKFKPWEWPRPYHELGDPSPDDDGHTRKARRLREELIAEIEGR